MQECRLRLRHRTHNTQSRGVPLSPNHRSPWHVRRSVTTHDAQRLRLVAESIALAFRDGVWLPGPMSARAAHDLSVEWRPWLEDLAGEVVAANDHRPDDAPRRLTRFVADRLVDFLPVVSDDEVLDWICRGDGDPSYGAGRISTPIVRIAMGPRPWPVPVIDDVADLARFLGMEPNELAWYADVKSLERTVRSENLRHYDYRWLPTRRGGERLIEAPKQNLKATQRQILHAVLEPIPPHDAAHGFRPGRSIQSYAAGHTAKDLVVRLDLRAFFTSVSAGRVFGIFRTAGYPEDVAHALTGLTTNAVPPSVLAKRSAASVYASSQRLRSPHLPQGAPTSPALANLAAYGLTDACTSWPGGSRRPIPAMPTTWRYRGEATWPAGSTGSSSSPASSSMTKASPSTTGRRRFGMPTNARRSPDWS